ncbi:MAG: hypothetical protein QM478_01800 [Flavobacteriaceae bacterium]
MLWGVGLGYEKLTQPAINYFPTYLNIMGFLTEKKNSVYGKLNFGTHLGDFDRSGFLFRGGLGLRFRMTKNILPIVEFTYSFQNIHKSFENSNRTENNYTLESVGLSLGFEIN